MSFRGPQAVVRNLLLRRICLSHLFRTCDFRPCACAPFLAAVGSTPLLANNPRLLGRYSRGWIHHVCVGGIIPPPCLRYIGENYPFSSISPGWLYYSKTSYMQHHIISTAIFSSCTVTKTVIIIFPHLSLSLRLLEQLYIFPSPLFPPNWLNCIFDIHLYALLCQVQSWFLPEEPACTYISAKQSRSWTIIWDILG